MTDRGIAVRVPTADQTEGEQRADDRAEVVHGPFEAVGPAVCGGGYDVGQQGVAGRDAEAARGPRTRSQQRNLPDLGGDADQAERTAVVV